MHGAVEKVRKHFFPKNDTSPTLSQGVTLAGSLP